MPAPKRSLSRMDPEATPSALKPEKSAPGLAADTQPRIRILLVDDHQMVREGIRRNLELFPHFEVVGEAASGLEAVEKAAQLNPDIMLLDITMPEMDGLETTQQVCGKSSAKV